MNYVLKVNGWPIKIFIMKLEIFSNEDRVYDPSVETKECEKNENVSNVNNVCFWNMKE